MLIVPQALIKGLRKQDLEPTATAIALLPAPLADALSDCDVTLDLTSLALSFSDSDFGDSTASLQSNFDSDNGFGDILSSIE